MHQVYQSLQGGGHLLELFQADVTTPEDLGSPDYNSVLLWIIWRVVTWDLEDGWNSRLVLDDHIPDSLSGTLRNENNANIGSGEEATERGVDLLVRSVTLDDHEVLHTTVIAFTHTGKKETSDS